MRKHSLYVLATLAFFALVANAAPKKKKSKAKQVEMPAVVLSTPLDTLSYAVGLAQSNGLRNYLVQQLKVDTTYIETFIKGLNDAVGELSPEQKAYNAGTQIGQQVKEQMLKGLNQQLFANDTTQHINQNNFMAGFIAGTLNQETLMPMNMAQQTAQRLIQSISDEQMELRYGANREEGKAFQAAYVQREGVQKTESGLLYRILTPGTGEKPTANDRVKVHYRGTLINGTEFDSSYKRNSPATFGVTQVIKGWTEALQLMPVGSKWEIVVPQDLAYGNRETGNIPPYSTLIFEVELLEIVK